VHAIKACAVENLDRNYKKGNIYILSESQAEIKVLGKYHITLKLVWDCHQSLTQLAKHKSSTDMGARSWGNCWKWISRSASKARIWTSVHGTWTSLWHLHWSCQESGQGLDKQKSQKHFESVTGLRRAKGLILGPSAGRTKGLLKLNRNQLRCIVGLFTGHYHLKGYLFKLGLTDDHTCERCLEKDESATRILCDCDVIDYLRFCHLGQFLWNQVTIMTPP
jgi:hypothetical protein